MVLTSKNDQLIIPIGINASLVIMIALHQVWFTSNKTVVERLLHPSFYHCISRCVRRAFLCGDDRHSGLNFEHRRQWMVERIRYLTDVFSIEVGAYAIMSNHYHLVLYVNERESAGCTDSDICERWSKVYSLSPIVLRWQKGELISDAEKEVALSVIAEWRNRLSSISWLIHCHPWRSPFGPAKAVLIYSR